MTVSTIPLSLTIPMQGTVTAEIPLTLTIPMEGTGTVDVPLTLIIPSQTTVSSEVPLTLIVPSLPDIPDGNGDGDIVSWLTEYWWVVAIGIVALVVGTYGFTRR